ncbi:unnamed protein product [Gadus morhua 'NCC']
MGWLCREGEPLVDSVATKCEVTTRCPDAGPLMAEAVTPRPGVDRSQDRALGHRRTQYRVPVSGYGREGYSRLEEWCLCCA